LVGRDVAQVWIWPVEGWAGDGRGAGIELELLL
jgi:hypothetical protein